MSAVNPMSSSFCESYEIPQSSQKTLSNQELQSLWGNLRVGVDAETSSELTMSKINDFFFEYGNLITEFCLNDIESSQILKCYPLQMLVECCPKLKKLRYLTDFRNGQLEIMYHLPQLELLNLGSCIHLNDKILANILVHQKALSTLILYQNWNLGTYDTSLPFKAEGEELRNLRSRMAKYATIKNAMLE